MRRFFGERNDLSALSDAELAALAGNGPGARAAFAELYERHIARIYQFCYLRTGNHHDAEDLTARVFARALAAIDRYEERGAPFVSWLFRIAHNLALNWQRDRQRHRIIPFDEGIPASNPEEQPETYAEQAEERARLLAAIGRLPSRSQQLLVLKFDEECTNAEIGAALGRSEGAVKSLYHRTLRALRHELGAAVNHTHALRQRRPRHDRARHAQR